MAILRIFKCSFGTKECRILKPMNYYAVARGRSPGVYHTWEECRAQVDKFCGARYKKFPSLNAAKDFIRENSGPVLPSKSCRQNSRPYPDIVRKPQNLLPHREENTLSEPKIYSGDDFPDFIIDDSIIAQASSTQDWSTRIINEKGFTIDSDGRTAIYTDGACSSNGRSGAKAGIGVFFGDNHPANISKPVRGRATNNNAEIQAVTEAARVAKKLGIHKIRIYTDSMFLINCITKWLCNWKKNGWRTASNQPVMNRVELEELSKALQPLDYVFTHVRGHEGIHGNEMADLLARSGAEMYE